MKEKALKDLSANALSGKLSNSARDFVEHRRSQINRFWYDVVQLTDDSMVRSTSYLHRVTVSIEEYFEGYTTSLNVWHRGISHVIAEHYTTTPSYLDEAVIEDLSSRLVASTPAGIKEDLDLDLNINRLQF